MTYEKFQEFKKLYEKAKAQSKESFIFEGQEILVSYAKYVIEYLETKFKFI